MEDLKRRLTNESALSNARRHDRGGGYSRNMRGGSYRDGGRGGSYARGRGQNAPRDSMGRYSRGGDMIDQLEDLKEDAPNDQIRQQIQQLISQVEKMM